MTAVMGARRAGLGRMLLLGASVLPFVAIASPAAAQAVTDQQAPTAAQDQAPPHSEMDQSATPTPENGSVPRSGDGQSAAVSPADATAPDVVVTGLRQSLATAQALKFNADQFVDSITATDIGKLPDKNVAEALQRISGVQITRNYGEGSSIAIRGLSQVKTELNGRDVFGGSDARSLGFEDVPSELLAGVDVYKDPSAKEIEGGIGGLINLRTRMPFDEKGFVVSATMGVNYLDLEKDARFNGSVLLSKTWTGTSVGDFGILVDLSYYESAFRRDQISIEPYVNVPYAQVYPNASAADLAANANTNLFVPDGAGIQVTEGNRKRKGIYAAAQWEPTTGLQFYGTYFRSQYDIATPNYASFVTRGTDTNYLNYLQPNGAFSFDKNGVFQSGGFSGFRSSYTGIPNTATADPYDALYVNTQLNIGNNSSMTYTKNVTADYAGGVKWKPTDHLNVNLDLQYERATSENHDFTAGAQMDRASYYIDMRNGDLPQISFGSGTDPFTGLSGGSIYDPANYRYVSIQDHLSDSVAEQKAARLDLEWHFDDGFLKSLQGGLRYTDRSSVNRSTPYNWTAANTGLTLASPESLGIPNPYYSTFFGGEGAGIVGPVPFASTAIFADPAQAVQTIGNRSLITFSPQDVNTQREKTYAGYGIAYFGFKAGIPIDGNLSVRVVRTTNEAIGSTRLTYRPDLGATAPTVTVDQPFSGTQEYTNVLPAVNLRGHLTDRLQLRVGASKGLSRPSFYDLRAIQQLSINYTQTNIPAPTADNPAATTPGPFVDNNSPSGSGGNPMLKPLTVDQADVALEWNAGRTTFLYGTLFYKKLHNFTSTRVYSQDFPVAGGGTRTFQYSAPVNINEGTVKGFEVGGNTFFDFLPGPLSGFGVQANLTYVDSDAPGDTGTLSNGQPVPTQLQGLSKWSYNVVGLYEKYGISARAAYNWRSEYLQTLQGNGTGNVPIYVRPYGQLDASISYNFTPKVSMSIDATNLLKERYDTYQYLPEYPRNYELNDRRFGLTFRVRN